MKALHTLGVLGLALGLGACTTVGPDYHLPEKAAINLPTAQGRLRRQQQCQRPQRAPARQLVEAL
jgi:hypothetical protein